MNTRTLLTRAALLLGGASLVPGTRASAAIPAAVAAAAREMSAPQDDAVAPAVAAKAQSFDLDEVTLLGGPFKAAMERDAKYLLALEPDRLLHGFRTNAGLEAKAPLYGGWESAGVAGHTLGHYLSALALQFRATGDARFKARVDSIVGELALCQSKSDDGFLSAIPDGRAMFAALEKGDGNALMRGWVPWYTQHKVMAGLRDAYLETGNQTARDVLVKMSDWTIRVTRNLSDAAWQQMLSQEHGGMNEVLADVYGFTGDAKYLDESRHFYHKAVLDPLAAGRDELNGIHSNTQVPKLIGLARLYELTGAAKDRAAAEYFWNEVVHQHSYVIGGDSDGEHFGAPGQLSGRLSPSTAETCNTYNMLKLTRHLWEWQPSVERADYYERALYNHILASQDPEQGMFAYYVSLKPGHFKTFSSPTESFWCCVGTGMENHVKYGDSIYFHDSKSLYVNLFIPSVLNWREKGVTVRQETRFPDANTTRLSFKIARPVSLALKVRCPAWLARPASFKINGVTQKMTGKAGTYATIARAWKSGDVLDITLPMGLHREAMPDDAHKIALLYGPIVLAGQLGREGMAPPMPFNRDAGAYFGVPDPQVPVLITGGKPLTSWIKPVAGQPLTFKTVGAGQPNDVTLKPFFRTAFDRYTVYWDTFTPAQWTQKQAEYRAEEARKRDLQARTVDEFRPGEQQSEQDHALTSQNSASGPYNGGHWRDARDGGYFAFDLQIAPGIAQDLVLTYWGGDVGNRRFRVLVDGQEVGQESLNAAKPNQYLDKTYALPAALLQGKTKVTVRLQAEPGAMAGGLFGARIVKR